MIVRHLLIFGRVQGVGFRYFFSREAARRGVRGWVRNRRDGSVESMLEGTPEAVEALIAWSRTGPPAAQVARVDVNEGSGHFTGFDTLRGE